LRRCSAVERERAGLEEGEEEEEEEAKEEAEEGSTNSTALADRSASCPAEKRRQLTSHRARASALAARDDAIVAQLCSEAGERRGGETKEEGGDNTQIVVSNNRQRRTLASVR
jgi:hypothetical protein